MEEDREDTEHGRLIAFKNLEKQPGDKRPAFEGELTLTHAGDERRVALWVHTTKKGQTLISGRVTRSAAEQIAELARRQRDTDDELITQAQTDGHQFAVDPQELLLFVNARKAEKSKAPDYWGYCNPGGDEPLMRLSVWAKTDARGNAMLSGSVKVHEPAREKNRERERRRERSR